MYTDALSTLACRANTAAALEECLCCRVCKKIMASDFRLNAYDAARLAKSSVLPSLSARFAKRFQASAPSSLAPIPIDPFQIATDLEQRDGDKRHDTMLTATLQEPEEEGCVCGAHHVTLSGVQLKNDIFPLVAARLRQCCDMHSLVLWENDLDSEVAMQELSRVGLAKFL